MTDNVDRDPKPAPEPAPAATEGAPAAPAPGDSKFCPDCGMPLHDGAILCTECGYDLRTGVRLQDGAQPPPPPAPPVQTAWQTFLDFLPGFYYPGIVLLAVGCAGVACGLAVFTLFVFGLGAYLTAGALGVATLAVWTQAVTLMCVGRAEFFNTALGDIEGTQFGFFLALVLAPPFMLWFILGWISHLAGD